LIEAGDIVDEDRLVAGTAIRSDIGGKPGIRVLRTLSDAPRPDQSLRWGGMDAHLARLYLKTTPQSQMTQAGKLVPLPVRHPMETVFRDIDEPCDWPMIYPLDIISFELPRAAIQLWAEDANHRNFKGLVIPSGMTTADQVIQSFGTTFVQCLESPDPAPQLFVDFLLDGLCGYLVDRYAGRETILKRGGLAPWQERRAKEIIDQNLGARLSLRTLAEACRLSVTHFSRAFRETTGQTPHRWLVERRLQRSADLLKRTDLPLSEIALLCGFADHSHFTNSFTRAMRMAPAAYRRAMGRAAEDDFTYSAPTLRALMGARGGLAKDPDR